MKLTDVPAIFLLLYIQVVSTAADVQLTTAVVVWDGTSELADPTNQTEPPMSDGSGEVTQALFSTSQATSSNVSLIMSNEEGQISTQVTSKAPFQSEQTVIDDGSGEVITQYTTELDRTQTVRPDTVSFSRKDDTTPLEASVTTSATSFNSTTPLQYASTSKFDIFSQTDFQTSTTPPEVVTTNMEVSTPSALTETTADTSQVPLSSVVSVSDSPSLPSMDSSSGFTSLKPPATTSESTLSEVSSTFLGQSSPMSTTHPQTTVLTATSTATTSTPSVTSTSTSTTNVYTTEETTVTSTSSTSTSTSTTTTTTTTTTVPTTTSPPDLGHPCLDNSSCSHIPGAVCDNVCRCSDGFYQTENTCSNGNLVTPSHVSVQLTGFITARLQWNIQRPSHVEQIFVTINTSRTDLTTNDRTFKLENLEYDSYYVVRVVSVVQGGVTFMSDVNFTTSPGEVRDVTVKTSDKNVSITWNPPRRQPPVDEVSYNVTVGDKRMFTRMTSIDTELDYDTCYNVSIFAETRVDRGPSSHVTSIFTKSGVPRPVRNLVVPVKRPRGVWVSWQRPEITNGQITAYFITVHNESGYTVFRRNLTCADCHTPCEPTTQVSNNSQGTGVFYSTQEWFNSSITDLYPYTSYKITVTPATADHAGPARSVQFRTAEDNPKVPVNVSLQTLERSVEVTWSITGRPNGITTYYVTTQDLSNSDIQNTTCVGMMCTVTGLTPFWNYTLQIVAVNSKNQSTTRKINFSTREDKPGPVTNLSGYPQDDVTQTTSLTVRWNLPLLRERNGILRNFSVLARCGTHSTVLTTNLTGVTLTDNIQPECRYNVTVVASTSRGNGTEVWEVFKTLAGAPPYSKLKPRESQRKVADPTQQVSLDIPRDLLCDASRGEIHNWGVVVLSAKDRNQRYRGTRSGYFVQHRQIVVNRTKTSGFCQVGGGETNVVVGTGNCDGPVCNTPLEPDTDYRFVVFVCTTNGCTETKPSERIFTDEREDSKTEIIGVVSGVLLIVLSCLLAAVLFKLWKKWKSVRPSVHFDAATIELGTKKSSLVSESQKTRPVKLQNFADQVEHLHRDSNLGFSEEYKALKQLSPKHPTKAAEQQACRTKNRYTNVLPFDHSRVKLLSQDDEEGSDYINANFITGYTCKREYIAAQGPLPCTKDDFWRLIWEHRIGMIVMLTQCKERGRIKCEKYWPDNTDPVYFGDLIVQLRSESVLPDYVIRILDVKQGNKKRVVRHFHFLKWPDFGCPEKTWLLLNFVSAVRAHMPHHQEGPTLVHCSAGVGRTGTFIAVDYLLQEIKEYSEVDIFGLVLQMRENRPLMVQTENQYIYIHDCIRDALQEDTDEEGSLEGEEEEEEEEEPIYQNA